MGGDRRDDSQNVIIPDIGAAKYWYVDPRAGVAQQPEQVYDPMADERSNQAQLRAWGEQPNYQQNHADMIEALRRMLLPEGTKPSF